MSVEKLLEVEIQDEFEKLSGLEEIGTEKYKVTVDGLTKLMDRAIEIDKLNIESEEKRRQRETDEYLKLQQMKEEKTDRLIKNILTGVSIGSGIILTVWGTVVTINFEKEGTFTSTAGRKFSSKVLSMFK